MLVAEIMNKYFIRPGDLNLPSQFQQPPDYVRVLIVKQEIPTQNLANSLAYS